MPEKNLATILEDLIFEVREEEGNFLPNLVENSFLVQFFFLDYEEEYSELDEETFAFMVVNNLHEKSNLVHFQLLPQTSLWIAFLDRTAKDRENIILLDFINPYVGALIYIGNLSKSQKINQELLEHKNIIPLYFYSDLLKKITRNWKNIVQLKYNFSATHNLQKEKMNLQYKGNKASLLMQYLEQNHPFSMNLQEIEGSLQNTAKQLSHLHHKGSFYQKITFFKNFDNHYQEIKTILSQEISTILKRYLYRWKMSQSDLPKYQVAGQFLELVLAEPIAPKYCVNHLMRNATRLSFCGHCFAVQKKLWVANLNDLLNGASLDLEISTGQICFYLQHWKNLPLVFRLIHFFQSTLKTRSREEYDSLL